MKIIILISLTCLIDLSSENGTLQIYASYHSICSLSTFCQSGDSNTVCVDSTCQCQPNYKYDITTGKCVYYNCDNSGYYCSQYDTNRECYIGICYCKDGYKADDNNGGKCKRFWETCSRNSDCPETYRVCVDGECHCEANYKWNSYLRVCTPYQCETDFDQDKGCYKDWDKMRKCWQGKCICDSGYNENSSNGNKCDYVFTSWTWLWAVIVFPIVFFALLIGLIMYCRRRRQSPGAIIYAGQQPQPVPHQQVVYSY